MASCGSGKSRIAIDLAAGRSTLYLSNNNALGEQLQTSMLALNVPGETIVSYSSKYFIPQVTNLRHKIVIASYAGVCCDKDTSTDVAEEDTGAEPRCEYVDKKSVINRKDAKWQFIKNHTLDLLAADEAWHCTHSRMCVIQEIKAHKVLFMSGDYEKAQTDFIYIQVWMLLYAGHPYHQDEEDRNNGITHDYEAREAPMQSSSQSYERFKVKDPKSLLKVNGENMYPNWGDQIVTEVRTIMIGVEDLTDEELLKMYWNRYAINVTYAELVEWKAGDTEQRPITAVVPVGLSMPRIRGWHSASGGGDAVRNTVNPLRLSLVWALVCHHSGRDIDWNRSYRSDRLVLPVKKAGPRSIALFCLSVPAHAIWTAAFGAIPLGAKKSAAEVLTMLAEMNTISESSLQHREESPLAVLSMSRGVGLDTTTARVGMTVSSNFMNYRHMEIQQSGRTQRANLGPVNMSEGSLYLSYRSHIVKQFTESFYRMSEDRNSENNEEYWYRDIDNQRDEDDSATVIRMGSRSTRHTIHGLKAGGGGAEGHTQSNGTRSNRSSKHSVGQQQQQQQQQQHTSSTRTRARKRTPAAKTKKTKKMGPVKKEPAKNSRRRRIHSKKGSQKGNKRGSSNKKKNDKQKRKRSSSSRTNARMEDEQEEGEEGEEDDEGEEEEEEEGEEEWKSGEEYRDSDGHSDGLQRDDVNDNDDVQPESTTVTTTRIVNSPQERFRMVMDKLPGLECPTRIPACREHNGDETDTDTEPVGRTLDVSALFEGGVIRTLLSSKQYFNRRMFRAIFELVMCRVDYAHQHSTDHMRHRSVDVWRVPGEPPTAARLDDDDDEEGKDAAHDTSTMERLHDELTMRIFTKQVSRWQAYKVEVNVIQQHISALNEAALREMEQADTSGGTNIQPLPEWTWCSDVPPAPWELPRPVHSVLDEEHHVYDFTDHWWRVLAPVLPSPTTMSVKQWAPTDTIMEVTKQWYQEFERSVSDVSGVESLQTELAQIHLEYWWRHTFSGFPLGKDALEWATVLGDL
jgi:hypothetical protein